MSKQHEQTLVWKVVGRIAVGVLAAVGLATPAAVSAAGSFVEVGDILTAHYYANKVVKITPQTGVQQKLADFASPMDLALAPNGDLFVGELGGAIKRLTLTNGAITIVNPASALTSVRGLTRSSAGDLYVTGRTNEVDVVMRVNPATGAESLIALGGDLSFPTGIEMLNPDYLVVASFLNSTLVKIRIADGAQTVIASGGELIDQPWGLAVSGDLIYVSHYDSKHVNRISATLGTTTLLGVAPGYPYGVGVDLDGNVLVGAVGSVGQQDMLARFTPQGVALPTFDVGMWQQISGIEVSPYSIGTSVSNTPPVLDPIADQTVDEGVLLSFTVTATDAEAPPQALTFSLGPGAPFGAAISPAGLFTWVPAATNGPGVYPISVIVTDDGLPPLAATNLFSVTVNDVNTGQEIVIHAGDILAASSDLDSVIQVNPQTGATRSLGTFVAPTDVALDPHGFLYVSEFDGAIQRVTLKTGAISLVNPAHSISNILGLTLGPAGELYATSELTDSIFKIDPATGAETEISQGNLLLGAYGIALLDPEHLVVASRYNNSLVSVALADGAQTLLASDLTLDMPWGVAVAGTNIFAACSSSQTILKVAAGQCETLGWIADGSPMGLAVEADGSLLTGVLGWFGGELVRLDPQGNVLNSWTNDLIGQVTGIKVAPTMLIPTNLPPVAGADTLQRFPADGTKVTVATLLANDSDPDGDPVQFVAVSPTSANGGTVTHAGGWIYYVPAPGFTNVDSFTYTIADSHALQATGTVSVQLNNNLEPSPNLTLSYSGSGAFRLRFDGVPGRTYRIEYSDSLSAPNWLPLGAATADAVGSFEYVDSPPAGTPKRYYRSVFP